MENPTEKVLEEKKVEKKADSGLENYSNLEFWDNRFKTAKGLFDWYADYDQIKKIVYAMGLEKSSRILMVGCGNSKLSEQMYDDGFTNIVNTDISPACIKYMQNYYEKTEKKMEWLVEDATALSFEDGSFDCVIDKGTVDALVCGEHIDSCLKLYREMARVTKAGAQFIVITYMGPKGRQLLYEDSIPAEQFITFYSKCNLCDKSDLINIMRNKLGDKPMNEMLKDKKKFIQAMLEFKMVQEEKEKQEKEPPKIYKLKYENFIMDWGDRLKDKSLVWLAKGSQTKEVDDTDLVPQINDFEKKDEIKDKEDPQSSGTVRQDHCFIYISKKTK